MLDPSHPLAPKYWMWEQSGALVPIVKAYLDGKPLTLREVRIMRAYLLQWVSSPVWGPSNELDALRARVSAIQTEDHVRAAIRAGLAIGIDPL